MSLNINTHSSDQPQISEKYLVQVNSWVTDSLRLHEYAQTHPVFPTWLNVTGCSSIPVLLENRVEGEGSVLSAETPEVCISSRLHWPEKPFINRVGPGVLVKEERGIWCVLAELLKPQRDSSRRAKVHNKIYSDGITQTVLSLHALLSGTPSMLYSSANSLLINKAKIKDGYYQLYTYGCNTITSFQLPQVMLRWSFYMLDFQGVIVWFVFLASVYFCWDLISKI